MRTARTLRARQGEEQRKLRGLLRRVSIAASGAFWQLVGYEDGADRETWDDVESFGGGIGIVARPRRGHGEAIVAHVGGEHGHPVVIAMRERGVEIAIGEDETAIYTSKAKVLIKADGTIELGGVGAVLTPLDGVVHGRGIDPFTGAPYSALGNVSLVVKAEKGGT